MFDHMKIVCLGVALLVALSGLSSVSFAIPQDEAAAPATSNPVSAVSLQAAQSSVVTAAALRAVSGRY
jgi:hypothetical protein